ncbi:ubiquitin-protein transferase activating protein [Tulasnella sp. JGI-2019a]|nr:ubiquitin-protein transferase activating protein [Tulasnella sp. JGI-2019a]
MDNERVKSPRKRASDDSYAAPIKKRPRMSLPTPLQRVSPEGASSSSGKRIDPRERLMSSNPSNLFLSSEHVVPYLKATPRTIRTVYHYGLLAPAYDSGGHWFDYSLSDHFHSIADHHMHGLARRKPSNPHSSLYHLSTLPRTILDGPGLVDDFYANTLSWSKQDPFPVAVGLGAQVFTFMYGSNPCYKTSEEPKVLYRSAERMRYPTTVEWAPLDGPSGILAVGMRGGGIATMDANSGQIVREWSNVHGSVNARALDWSGHTLACGYGDGSIQLFDVRSPPGSTNVRCLKGHRGKTYTAGGVGGVKWRRDGVLLASGGNDNLVNCWDVRMIATTRKEGPLHVWKHGGGVKALAWCPWQENILACGAGSADGRIYFRSTHTGDTINTISLRHQITSLHFSQTCKEIVSLTGFRSPDRPKYSRDRRFRPLLPQTPKTQRRKTSLAFITRPGQQQSQQPHARQAFEPLYTTIPTTPASERAKIQQFSIVTHRYPSLEHVRTVPNWPFIRMTMGALSPDGTMLLTAGAEALTLRTVWGKSSNGSREHGGGLEDADVVR